jgi:hypothetical protein
MIHFDDFNSSSKIFTNIPKPISLHKKEEQKFQMSKSSNFIDHNKFCTLSCCSQKVRELVLINNPSLARKVLKEPPQ